MSRSLLLYVPGVPLRSESLMPQHALASMASCLIESGHGTRIVDYGTIEGVARFVTPGLRAAGREISEAWHRGAHTLPFGRFSGLRPLRAFEALFDECRETWRREIAVEAAGIPALDFVLFLVKTREDLREARQVAAYLHDRFPSIRLVIAGPYVDECSTVIMSGEQVFDAACLSDIEITLPALGNHISQPEAWSKVPNLVYRDGQHIRQTSRKVDTDLDGFPAPRYDAAVYPGIRGVQQFRLFTLEQSRGGEGAGHGASQPYWGSRKVRTRAPGALWQAMHAIRSELGGQAFHITGNETPATQVDALATAILRGDKPVHYSRSGHVQHLDPSTLTHVAKSGCHAMSMQIDTGSQRLLDDFYCRGFGVSEMEQVLRASRAAGIFTVAGLTYPCPEDDYHTRAETLRILRRCKPHGAPITAPWLGPGSRWHQEAASFGYRVDPTRFHRWLAALDTCGSWFDRLVADVPYRMSGWSRARVVAEHITLAREITEEGVLTPISEREGLVARLAGYAEEEGRFSSELHRALFTFDVPALARFVSEFNDNVTVSTNTVSFRPFHPVLAAVGN